MITRAAIYALGAAFVFGQSGKGVCVDHCTGKSDPCGVRIDSNNTCIKLPQTTGDCEGFTCACLGKGFVSSANLDRCIKCDDPCSSLPCGPRNDCEMAYRETDQGDCPSGHQCTCFPPYFSSKNLQACTLTRQNNSPIEEIASPTSRPSPRPSSPRPSASRLFPSSLPPSFTASSPRSTSSLAPSAFPRSLSLAPSRAPPPALSTSFPSPAPTSKISIIQTPYPSAFRRTLQPSSLSPSTSTRPLQSLLSKMSDLSSNQSVSVSDPRLQNLLGQLLLELSGLNTVTPTSSNVANRGLTNVTRFSSPSNRPTTFFPSNAPTVSPTTRLPTSAPTRYPTAYPTPFPTLTPTTSAPTLTPTKRPTRIPTKVPTTQSPTYGPTESPTTPDYTEEPLFPFAPSSSPATFSASPSPSPTTSPTVTRTGGKNAKGAPSSRFLSPYPTQNPTALGKAKTMGKASNSNRGIAPNVAPTGSPTLSMDTMLAQITRISTQTTLRDDPRLVTALVNLVSQLLVPSSSTVVPSSVKPVTTAQPTPLSISPSVLNAAARSSSSTISVAVQDREVNLRVRLRPTKAPSQVPSQVPSRQRLIRRTTTSPTTAVSEFNQRLTRQVFFNLPVPQSSIFDPTPEPPTSQPTFSVSRIVRTSITSAPTSSQSIVTQTQNKLATSQSNVLSSVVRSSPLSPPQVAPISEAVEFRTAPVPVSALSPIVSNLGGANPAGTSTVRLPSFYDKLMPRTSRPTPRWQHPDSNP